MTIKERVQMLLKEKNFSAVRMEQDLGFAKGYISKLDKASPSADNIVKIANYLCVPTDILLKDTETTSVGVDISAFPQQNMVKISDEAKEVALIYDTLDDAGKQAFRDLLNIVAKRP